jgi:hypothetical protein
MVINSGTGGQERSASILIEIQRINVSAGGCKQTLNIQKNVGKINMCVCVKGK